MNRQVNATSILFLILLGSGCRRDEASPIEPVTPREWTQINVGFWDPNYNSINVTALLANASAVFAGTDSGVYISTNQGANWLPRTTGLPKGFIRSFALNSSYVFAGTDSGLYRTSDAGVQWSAANQGLPISSVFSLTFCGSSLIAGMNARIFRSTDNGSSWIDASNGLVNSSEVFALQVKGTSVFAGTLGGAFRSTDGGLSWTPIDSGFTGNYINVHALAVSASSIYATLFGMGVYRSTNDGDTWQPVNNGLTNLYVGTIVAIGSSLFVGGANGAFLSTNSGQDWSSTGLTKANNGAYVLASDGTFLYAGTVGLNGGMWRYPLH